ncbi:substrate-binding domain-containing protein [Opitutus sp. GAS368]|uniref:PstS family phosphate ABC transporter substrate-binding protein n=1 Tax=Opitutus sp. GAS368 TaxID=1882749 RepID=UPI00087930F0|nr:substrate-binding domain-containing protein [Opitutus sp. GAS368]SDR90055.1 phosphate transport system substrate-binding protein [Opitutus sp. GAS368]
MKIFRVAAGIAALFTAAGALGAQNSALPDYQPGAPVSGVIRISSGKVYGAKLLANWEAGFRKFHPDARFEISYGKGSGAPLRVLCSKQSDVALMGREMTPLECVGYYREFTNDPLTITAATGSYIALDKTMALVVIVHPDNPLASLTLEQLDGIFGEQRAGGYEGQYWRTDRARGPEKNLRTWGQLGLKGEWADKPIQTYGYDILRNGFSFFFSQQVLHGGDKWNPNLTEFGFSIANGEMGIKGASHLKGSAPLVEAVAANRYSIGFCTAGDLAPSVRALALAPAGGAPVAPSKENVISRAYPLTRSIYLILNRPAGAEIEPKLREFLRYVLSRQGQDAVAHEGDYLPLPAAVVRENLQKLE